MHRSLVPLVGLWLIVSPGALGLTPGAVPDAAVDRALPLTLLPGETQYVVGVDGLDRTLKPGDTWQGARILRINPVLHFLVVATHDPEGFEAQAATDRDVRYVEPDPVRQLVKFTPNDPQWTNQYGPQQVRADLAWDTSLGDEDAAVCVGDTGVRYSHEDITGSRYKGGRDIINSDNDPWDDNGHGTHVMGTAAGSTNNGKGIAGVGQVAFYAVKLLNAQGSGTWSQVADGITWCADNTIANTVISLSLGGSAGQQVLEDAVNYAVNTKNKLVVAAAGNDGPCNNCVNYPAAYPNAIAVTCTTSTEAQCSFSSDGPESDLAAPGNGILSTCFGSDTQYCSLSGTSMSTPHVSGVAAFVWSQAPTKTRAEVRALLEDNAKDLGAAGWDEQFGWGLVDMKAALDAAGGPPPPPPPPENRVTYEDFDDGTANGWTLGGLWHVSSTCSTPPSSPRYLGYNEDVDCEYSTGARTTGSATFTVDLTGATVGTLKLQQRREVESYTGGAYDIQRIEISTNGGSTWTTLEQWDSRNANQLTWGQHTEDLDAYAGGSRQVRFFFDSVDGSFNNFDGWYLDNVEVTADIGGGTNQPPTANAGPDQTKADADGTGAESVTLNGSGSSDPDGTIVSYEWKEGSTTIATGATPTVSLAVGSHTIVLTVTDDDGATGTDTVVVTVNANQAPTASFTDSCSQLTCTFNGGGSTDPDGTISSWAWNFGDGGTGSGSSVSHTYAAAGTYTVTLTVTDNGGAQDSDSRAITVSSGQTPFYSIGFENGGGGWEESTNSLWRLGTGCLGAHGGTTALMYNNANTDCTYNTGGTNTGWARSPNINLAGKTTATLKFWHAYEVEQYSGGAYDTMRVQVSSNGGTSWTTLQQWDSRNPNQLGYVQKEYDVSSYISSTFRVRYLFNTVDGTNNNFDGWHVDDIEVFAS